MVEHIIQLQQPLCVALRTELMPTDTETSTMEIFIEVLKPVVEIAEAIGSEKSVIISTIGPLLYKLLSQKLPENPSDKPLAKTLKCVMLADFIDRYDSKEELVNKACLLDPCCNAMSFLSQTERRGIAHKVVEEALEIAVLSEQSQPLPEADDQLQSPEDSPAVKKRKKVRRCYCIKSSQQFHCF